MKKEPVAVCNKCGYTVYTPEDIPQFMKHECNKEKQNNETTN